MKWRAPLDKILIWRQSGKHSFNIEANQHISLLIWISDDIESCHLIFNLSQESKLDLKVINGYAPQQKIELEINLQGQKAHADIKGIYILDTEQKFSMQTMQN